MITQRGNEIILHPSNSNGAFFDLDGTLTANTAHHLEAWQQFAQIHRIPFTEQWFHKECVGKTSRDILTLLFKQDFTPKEQKELFNQRFAIYKEIFEQHGTEIGGLTPFLHTLRAAGFKLALVTSGSPPTRSLQLNQLGLVDTFHHTIGSEHVQKTKPHPEPYLQALDHFNLMPDQCVVFEDSRTGVQAAVAASIPTIGVSSTHTADELRDWGASATIEDYTQIRVDET
jgi:HAD superfamily hydrolase (TIGR01509 family)